MDDFQFLDKSRQSNNFSGLDDEERYLSFYYELRKQMERESIGSAKSLSLLSLGQASLSGEPAKNPLSVETSDKFKRPKTPPLRTPGETSNTRQNAPISGASVSKRQNISEAEKILQAELARADGLVSSVKSSRRDSYCSTNGKNMSSVSEKVSIGECEGFMAPSMCTPRVFKNELDSVTPDQTPMVTRGQQGNSINEFPVRDKSEIFQLLEKAEKKFIPNSSGFSHNSDVSSFSGILPGSGMQGENGNMSIGEFFAQRSDRLSFIGKGVGSAGFHSSFLSQTMSPAKSRVANEQLQSSFASQTGSPPEAEIRKTTMSYINNLLGEVTLSGSQICDQLIAMKCDVGDRLTLGDSGISKIEERSPTRQSTPVAMRIRQKQMSKEEVTPVCQVLKKQPGRIPFNMCTPMATNSLDEDSTIKSEGSVWQEMRQSMIDSNSSKNSTIKNYEKDSLLEQTLAAGNLSALSNRLNAIPSNAKNSEKQLLLSIIKKLASYPAGNINSAPLLPLIRKEFPEISITMEENHCTPSADVDIGTFTSSPNCWVMVPKEPVKVKTTIGTKIMTHLDMLNKSRYLLVDVSDATLSVNGSISKGVKNGDAWILNDSVEVTVKSTAVPPDSHFQLPIHILCDKYTNNVLKLSLRLEDLQSGVTKNVPITLLLSTEEARNQFSFSPVTNADFGTLPENCYEEREFKIGYRGVDDIQLDISLSKDSVKNYFTILKDVEINGNKNGDIKWKEGGIQITIHGGKAQEIKFAVRFNPTNIPNLEDEKFEEFETEIIVVGRNLGDKNAVLEDIARTKLIAKVAFTKFLCRVGCSPMVFEASDTSKEITRQFHLMNVGIMPLELVLQISSTPYYEPNMPEDDYFSVPSVVKLPVGEATFNITFKPHSRADSKIQRYLLIHLLPNGNISYDFELLGIIRNDPINTIPIGPVTSSLLDCDKKRNMCSVGSSNSSVKSGSTAISRASTIVPLKLTSSTSALSWPATPLLQAVGQTFQIKLKSEMAFPARISIKGDSTAFKIINEKGERLDKIRKNLKPDAQYTISVSFRPDMVGLHQNQLAFEFDSNSQSVFVQLTGYGGVPKLRIEDTQLDLQGNRMVKLDYPRPDSSVFASQFCITNYGNVAGFVQITPSTCELVAHSLKVYPTKAVIEPNSNVVVSISQNLSRQEIHNLLQRQDIRRLGTLSLVMGDEPSRQRMRRHVKTANIDVGESMRKLIEEFPNEKLNLNVVKESPDFPIILRSKLIPHEIAVVIEKVGGVANETFADLDESVCDFEPLSDTILVRPSDFHAPSEARGSESLKSRKKSPNSSSISAGSQDDTSSKVRNWLRNV